MRKITINPSTMTAVNPSTQLIDQTIPHRMKLIIYDTLEEAIKPTAISTFLSMEQEIQTDVHSLFAALDSRYGKSSKTSISRLQSKSKFYNIGKRQNEKMKTFFERFKAAQIKGKCQNMDQQELATHYLSALGDNTFTQIILDINDGIRDQWWTTGLETTHKKASQHLESLKKPRIHNPNDIRYYGRGNGTGTGNTNPNTGNRGQGTEDSNAAPQQLGYKAQLKEWFPTTPTKAKLLAKSKSMHFKCNRHAHYTHQHSILQCNSYTTVANSLGWETVWKEAKDEEREQQGGTIRDGVPRANRVTIATPQSESDGTTNQQESTSRTTNNPTNTRVNAYESVNSRVYRTTTTTPTPPTAPRPQSTISTQQPTMPTRLPSPENQSSGKPRTVPSTSTPKRKWHYFAPKPNKTLDVKRIMPIPLPPPTVPEVNYLQNTTACWDVVTKTHESDVYSQYN